MDKDRLPDEFAATHFITLFVRRYWVHGCSNRLASVTGWSHHRSMPTLSATAAAAFRERIREADAQFVGALTRLLMPIRRRIDAHKGLCSKEPGKRSGCAERQRRRSRADHVRGAGQIARLNQGERRCSPPNWRHGECGASRRCSPSWFSASPALCERRRDTATGVPPRAGPSQKLRQTGSLISVNDPIVANSVIRMTRPIGMIVAGKFLRNSLATC